MASRALNQKPGIVIVGGGLAGQRCAEALRRHGYEGPVRMICAEPHRPYDRPPLSKELLAGGRAPDSVVFKTEQWYEAHAVELLLDLRATELDVSERRVRLSDGGSVRFEQLVIATGSRPRRLPVLDGYDNVSSLRSLDDSLALRDVLARRPRLAVIGAGFIGQEVAATARGLGAGVTLVEAGSAPLASLLGAEIGNWFARLHAAESVEVLTGCTVIAPVANGSICGLRLSNGRLLETDHVVVGVGVAADVEWLSGTGLATALGVGADYAGRTPVPNVFAVGDAAATYDPVSRRHVSGSHWEAAARQAGRCARAMLGLAPGPASVTSFWTDQYGTRIQYLGRAELADTFQIAGDPAQRDFTVTFLRSARPVAALLVGRSRELPALRNLIEKGAL